MNRTLPRLLLVVLLLTLPLRVVAAVTMVACAAHMPPAAHAMEHDHPGGMPHAHDHGGGHGHHDSAHHAATSCSACGDCCLGMFSLPLATPLQFGNATFIPALFIATPYAGFKPEGPERPPRRTVL